MREGIGSACPTQLDGPLGAGCACLIVGLAGLAGTVEEAELGFRGSHGKVLALLTPTAEPWQSSCDCQSCTSRWGHHPAEHLPGLVARYQVPAFAAPEELIGYARRYTSRPIAAERVTDYEIHAGRACEKA